MSKPNNLSPQSSAPALLCSFNSWWSHPPQLSPLEEDILTYLLTNNTPSLLLLLLPCPQTIQVAAATTTTPPMCVS